MNAHALVHHLHPAQADHSEAQGHSELVARCVKGSHLLWAAGQLYTNAQRQHLGCGVQREVMHAKRHRSHACAGVVLHVALGSSPACNAGCRMGQL